MKKIAIMIVFMMLLVGISAAQSICPLTPEEPSEISMGITTGNVTTAGSVNGFLGYSSTAVIGSKLDIISVASRSERVGSMGVFEFASTTAVSSDAISGDVVLGLGGGNAYGYDTMFTMGASETAECNNETTITPFCEHILSTVSMDLRNGQFASSGTVTPIAPSGGISQIAGVEGNGAARGSYSMLVLEGCGTVTDYIRAEDQIHMSGSNLTFARIVDLQTIR